MPWPIFSVESRESKKDLILAGSSNFEDSEIGLGISKGSIVAFSYIYFIL
jgi:hypothetical protein